MDRALRNQLIEHLEKSIRPDFDCLEIEWDPGEHTMRIFIDNDKGEVTLDDCAQVNLRVADDDFVNDLISDDTMIEVSSPGVSRPLRTIDHFNAAIGKTIKVKLLERSDNRLAGKGVLQEVGHGAVKIQTNRGPWSFSLEKLDSAFLSPMEKEWDDARS